MRVRRWLIGTTAVFVLGSTIAAIAAPTPPAPGPHWVIVDDVQTACGILLPPQRYEQGERGQLPSQPDLFLGSNLTMTNQGVAFNLMTWWLESEHEGTGPYTIVWQLVMPPYAKGPYKSPWPSTAVIEWPPGTQPQWNPTRLRLGTACRPGPYKPSPPPSR